MRICLEFVLNCLLRKCYLIVCCVVLQVCNWLAALKLEQYSNNFLEKRIDGMQILNIDTTKMKVHLPTFPPSTTKQHFK